ncbi:MAG: SGNH/GDSL hydrolase family protein [Lachnospiraceae bacterium]|nr:SGNH/GDSL hydrolase family protein [Lachnospiraceae bacterium]
MKQPKKLIMLIIPCCAAVALLVCFFLIVLPYLKMAPTRKLLRESEYNCVFLSMFPVSTFDKEDFSYFRADDALIVEELVPNARAMKSYLKDVTLSGNKMQRIYLGVDPTKITAEQILEFQAAFPDAVFEILPTYRRLSDWMKDPDWENTYAAYLDMVQKLVGKEKLSIYSFFAQEWLIADDDNYLDGTLLTQRIAHILYIYADIDHRCDFRPENVTFFFTEFHSLLKESIWNGFSFPDLSSWEIIMLGDSVIGNYSEHDSIPELVASFSGAKTYNCGWGGASAATRDSDSCGSNMVKAFLSGDLSTIPNDVQAYSGMKAFWNASSVGEKQLFVLHFGLNDYFQAVPLDNPKDPKDVTTYCGALRSMIEMIQAARPDAKILLIAPNPVLLFHYGKDPLSDEGAPLADYADAVLSLGESYGIPVLNDYEVLHPDTAYYYLSGDVHPNEYGRYKIAKALIYRISDAFE